MRQDTKTEMIMVRTTKQEKEELENKMNELLTLEDNINEKKR